MFFTLGWNAPYLYFSKPLEPDRLFDCLPQSLRPTAASPAQDAGGKKQSEQQNKSQEAVVYRIPTLIPPRIIPLLHELAHQMFSAGHQQELFSIYRSARICVLNIYHIRIPSPSTLQLSDPQQIILNIFCYFYSDFI